MPRHPPTFRALKPSQFAMHPPFVPYPFMAERHAPCLPPLVNGADPHRHPVVVVGGGPVGYCTALGLVRQGVPVVVLEADDSVCVGSRAICVSRRSLEIFNRLGALEGFLKVGLPWVGGRSFYRQREVLHFLMHHDHNQKLPPMLNLAQYSIEQILLDALQNAAQARPGLVEIRWLNQVRSVTAGTDGVRLGVSTPLGGYTLDADWLVAADGGRSAVREALNLPLQGTSYEGRYVIVDILMKSPRPAERLAFFDPPCNPGSTVLVHKQPNDVWRIDYQLQDGEDADAAIQPDQVLPRVHSLLSMMGETAPWNPIWMGIYKAHALTLEQYRHGRVLFAGDAAHLLPIFGVRGANSGIDDADNLAWKLAYVVKGWGGEKLLHSYGQERVAAAHENLRHASKSTEFMAPPSFAFDLMRRAVLSLASAQPGLRSLINPRQTTAITYNTSPLNAAASRSAQFAAGPVPGAVLPECPLMLMQAGRAGPTGQLDHGPREGHLTDLLQPCFSALLFADEATVPAAWDDIVRAMARRQVPFQLLLLTRQRGQHGGMGATAATGSARTSVVSGVVEWPDATDATDATGATGATGAAVATGLAGAVAQGWDHTGRLFPMYGAQPGSFYLVRPDGHVLGRWRQARAPECAEALAALEHALAH